MSVDDVDPLPLASLDALIGKSVIVGLTWLDADGSELRREQHHGRIKRADEGGGVEVALADGEVLMLPAEPEAFLAARPGVYRLRSTGEEVVDPDLTAAWAITQAEE